MFRIFPLLLTLLFSVSSLGLLGQVKLTGTVEHDGSGLDNVTIQILAGDKLQRSLSASKKGRYELDLPIGKSYLLVFRRPYMFPVRIAVDTRLGSDIDEEAFEVPLDMTMFYRFEGMRESLTEDNIGTIKQTGTGENTFSFVPNLSAIEKLKALKEESVRRERKREGAVEAPQKQVEKEVEEAKDDLTTAVQDKELSKAEDKLTPTMDLDETPTKLRRQEERYEIIESAKNIELAGEREKQGFEDGSFTSKTETANQYIRDSKRQRAQLISEDQRRKEALIDAAVRRQESEVEALKSAPTGNRPTMSKEQIQIIKFALDEGWLSQEETILVKQNEQVDTYKKVLYDWLVLDWAYYYLNDIEISKKEYDRIRSLVEM